MSLLPFRLAVFSVAVLKQERVVLVAEQRHNCTDEQAFTWMNSVVPAIESIHSINLYGLVLVKPGHLPRVGVVAKEGCVCVVGVAKPVITQRDKMGLG